MLLLSIIMKKYQLRKYFVVKPAWGPLARDMDSVALIAKIMLDGGAVNKIDPLVPPLPFNEEVSFI